MNKFREHSDKCLHDDCGKLCGADGLTYVITRLELVEGQIVEQLEKMGSTTTLHELIEAMDTQPCIVSMGVGSLIKEGVVKCTEVENDVVLKLAA